MKRVLALVLVLASLGFVACAGRIVPVASHVTVVGPNLTVDDVWVVYDEVLKRCTNSAEGPVCVTVKNR